MRDWRSNEISRDAIKHDDRFRYDIAVKSSKVIFVTISQRIVEIYSRYDFTANRRDKSYNRFT